MFTTPVQVLLGLMKHRKTSRFGKNNVVTTLQLVGLDFCFKCFLFQREEHFDSY